MARPFRTQPGPYLSRLELAAADDARRYPRSLPALRGLTSLPFHPKVTFLVGENGAGKSTLLEAIAVACGLNPEGGSRNFEFSTRATHSPLAESVELVRTPAVPADSYFLRAETFYNVATEIERLDEAGGGRHISQSYGKKPLHEQSHGESFFALFEHRFGPHGLYLLDEPEAALSPNRQLQFLVLLHDFVKRGGQFVIATHSPMILAYPDALIYQLDDAGTRPVAYEATEHFTVTRGFLANPRRTLDVLLADEGAE